MCRLRKLRVTLSLWILTFAAQGQTNLDSLFTIWQDGAQADSSRTNAYTKFIWDGFLFSNPDTAFVLAQSMLRFGEEQPYKKAKATAYLLMGNSNYLISDYPKALGYYQRSVEVYGELGDKQGAANCINNIGNIYKAQGAYPKALDYYQRSLKIQEEIGDKKRSANAIGNIGLIYNLQGASDQALVYFQRSLKLKKETGDKQGSAYAMGNVGNIYADQGDYDKALSYFQRSLEIEEEIGDIRGSANSIRDIGKIYLYRKDYVNALIYFRRSLKAYEETGDKKGSAASLVRIGEIYRVQGDNAKALVYCKNALAISQEIGALDQEKKACQCLYDLYKFLGKGNEALIYLEKLTQIGDSLNAKETAKTLQQMEFSKQVLTDSIAAAEEARLVNESHQEEVRQKNKTRNFLAGGGIFLFLIAGGIYGRLRYTRKAKAIIEKEKDRSENLLLNILPADIAAELKEKGRADARDFERVSILFTDFKGFTSASEKLTAQELVVEINTCFEAFDGIMGKYHIEKIKTIGDAYMAAGGLPIPTDDSVKNTVLAALEMQAFIGKRKAKMDAMGLPAFEMRAGIHTGAVVAGIVGIKKFQYDIWGDTVNTASRMESSGEIGQVNISQKTYKLIMDDPQFAFESRGKIEAKGKGVMEMWFVSLKQSFSNQEISET